MLGAPPPFVGVLKKQQAEALGAPLAFELERLGSPSDALGALSGVASQQGLYLLLLALIKKTCSSGDWRRCCSEGRTRQQVLLLLQQQLDSLAAALAAFRREQHQQATPPAANSSNREVDADPLSSSSCSISSSSNSSSSSSRRVVETAGVLCAFVRLLRNLCVGPSFLDALLEGGLLSRLVSSSQVGDCCSAALQLLSAPAAAAPPAAAGDAAAAAAAAAAAGATAEAEAEAAAASTPYWFDLSFLCAEGLLLPQALLQLLANAAAAAAAAPAAPAAAAPAPAAAASEDDKQQTRRLKIWKAVGRLQLLELALWSTSCDSAFAFLHLLFGCSDAAAKQLTEEHLLEVRPPAAAAAAAAAAGAPRRLPKCGCCPCLPSPSLVLLQLQAALFFMAAREAAASSASEQGTVKGPPGAPRGPSPVAPTKALNQGECGEWTCLFCCSLLTRLNGRPFVALLEFIQNEMTADVLELFSLALLSPSEGEEKRGEGGPPPPPPLVRSSFLLQQLQQKFTGVSRRGLFLFLLGLAEALMRQECSSRGPPSKLMQSAAASVCLLHFLRRQIEAAIRGLRELQQAQHLYFFPAAAAAAAASASSAAAAGSAAAAKADTDGFFRFVCGAAWQTGAAAAHAEAAQQPQQHSPQQQQQQQQEQEYFDLLLFNLPQPSSPSLLEKVTWPRASSAGKCSEDESSSNSSSRKSLKLGDKPSWLRVSDSAELVGGLLSHVAEAGHICCREQQDGEERPSLSGGRGSEEIHELACEKRLMVSSLVELLRLYQQQRVLAAWAAKGAAGGPPPSRPPPTGLPEGGPPPQAQPGEEAVWQLLRWSLNSTLLLKALANLCADSEAARAAAIAADALPVLSTFSGIEETSPFAREAAVMAMKVLSHQGRF
ncbi:hypothetical protein Efla_005671 [Eimeria flavescens]